MPTSILTYREIIESYINNVQCTNQSVTKPPIGPPNPKPSYGGIEVSAKSLRGKKGCM